jgi:hypothetical protein
MIAIEWDPVTLANLLLCIAIVLLGILCWKRSRDLLPLWIAAGFGLFGISHAATLLGFREALTLPLLLIRTLAYLTVIYALVMHLKTTLIGREARDARADCDREERGPAAPGRNGQQ